MKTVTVAWLTSLALGPNGREEDANLMGTARKSFQRATNGFVMIDPVRTHFRLRWLLHHTNCFYMLLNWTT